MLCISLATNVGRTTSKMFSLPVSHFVLQILLVTLLYFHSQAQDSDFLENPNREWFRVRRLPREGQAVQNYHPRSHHAEMPEEPDIGYSREPEIVTEEEELEPLAQRQRRLYAPPVYTSEPSRRYPETGNGGNNGNQCKCDLEYVLKYRSLNPGDHPPGAYHVKIYHEETGEFRDTSGGSGQTRYPGEYQRYPENPGRGQQVERPHVHYYVEHVDQPRDRGDVYVRGGGGAGKPRSEVVRGRSEDVDDRVYKSRNRVVKSVASRKMAKIARKVWETANWASLSTVIFPGWPYTEGCLVGMGKFGNPYLYVRSNTISENYNDDLEIPVASLTTSLSSFEDLAKCTKHDAKSVECASVTVFGKIIPVTSTEEMAKAADTILVRNPKLEFNENGHFAKLVVKNVVLTQYSEEIFTTKVALFDYKNPS